MVSRNGCQRQPRPRRVAHITLGLDVGGQEKLLVEFARHADRQRYELLFVSLTTRGPVARELEDLGCPVVGLESPGGFRPDIVLRLVPLLRRLRIDVVHTHDSKPLIYGVPAARLAGVPRIVHTRHFAQLSYLTRRQTMLANCAARLADVYVCVSHDSARVAVEQGVSPRVVQTVWNGIDTDRFAFSGPRADGPAVLVARLSPEKDIATLVHAVAIVVRDRPDFHLDIAGSGPCAADLRRLANELHLTRNVRFLGEVRDVPRLLSEAGMFVLSSLTEGISLTLLEAMAVGLPVVATKVGGNPEVVVDGQTGLLVPPRDAAALARAMFQLHPDRQRGKDMGLAGRERVQRCFDIRRMVAAYEALYAAGSTALVRVTG